MMVGIHLVLLFSASGRYLSVDAVRARNDAGRRLALTWGAVGLAGGFLAVALSLGDPRDPSGPSLRTGDLPVGIGTYNVLGGVVVLVVGAALVAWARSPKPGMALAAAIVAALAAVSLYAQLGFSDPILGGSAPSAALNLTLATIAGALALTAGGRPGRAKGSAPGSRTSSQPVTRPGDPPRDPHPTARNPDPTRRPEYGAK